MYSIIIGDTTIDVSDVLGIDLPTKDVINFLEFKLDANSASVTLNNVDPTKYDPDESESIFYEDWYNTSLQVIDQDTEYMVFSGKIKSREKIKTTSKNTVIIKADSILKDILNIPCQTSYGTSSSLTPSEIILSLLQTDCAIPITQINAESFNTAKNLQIAGSAYLRVAYSASNSRPVGEVINTIMQMTNSHLYTINNIFFYAQWQPFDYTQDSGTGVKINDIVNGTYKRYTDDKTIINDYLLVYKNASTTVTTITASGAGNDVTATEAAYLAESKTLHGTRTYRTYDETTSTTLSDYDIVYLSLASAQWYGRLLFQRFYAIQELCDFAFTFNKLNIGDISLNSQLDFTYENFSREPLKIFGRELKKKTNIILLSCYFYDKPHLPGEAERDSTKPSAVELALANVTGENQITLKWTETIDDDVTRYYIYISKDGIEWNKIFPGIGVSPLYIEPDDTTDNFCFYTINNFETNFRYYFKVTAVDSSLNESDDSNILDVYVYDVNFSAENLYRTDGDIISGIYPVIDNVHSGYLVSGYTHYDDLDYDEGTYEISAVYESFVLYSTTGFESILFQAVGEAGDIVLYWRTYNNGSFGEWSSAIDALAGIVRVSMSGAQYIQIRYIFSNTSWTTTDNIRILQVNEI